MNDLKLRLPYQDCLKRVGWRLASAELLGGDLPTTLAWNNSLHLKRIRIMVNLTFLHLYWGVVYLSIELYVFVKKVGLRILLQILEHLSPTIWSKMFHPLSTSLPTSEWWRNDFCWLAKGKSGKAMTFVDKEKNLEEKSSSPLLEG